MFNKTPSHNLTKSGVKIYMTGSVILFIVLSLTKLKLRHVCYLFKNVNQPWPIKHRWPIKHQEIGNSLHSLSHLSGWNVSHPRVKFIYPASLVKDLGVNMSPDLKWAKQ